MDAPAQTSFRQKRSGFRARFEFGEEELTYSFDNSRSKAGGAVPYHKIPSRANYRGFRLWWLQYAAVFAVTACAIAWTNYWSMDDIETAAAIVYATVLLFLFACLAALLRRRSGMTTIALDPALCILHDGQQEAILSEINQRRVLATKKKLAQVDFNRPYFEEARKFRWLKEEGIIDESEYRRACQQIAAMRDKAGMAPPAPGKIN